MQPVRGGCWWVLAAAVVGAVLWAGPASADTALDVDAGYAGAFLPGLEVPVRVRITADHLVRGTLEVEVGTPENGVPVALPVEVPGGSQKQFLLTAPSGYNQNPDVVVRLRQDDRLVASGQVTLRAAGDTELVGVLPGALRGRAVPGVAPLTVDAGTARFAAVGDAELEAAPASLAPLSTLAADGDDLARLSPGARAGVLRWLDSGGHLLVDVTKNQKVAGLPDAWQPGARGRAPAGLGEVVATSGAIAGGRWSGLVEPSSWGTVSTRFNGDQMLAGSLASDAGLRTPDIGWLVGFLVVYVVVVGPGLFLAVRRRGRPELAWLAVPLVALLFSTGSYAVGHNLRKTTQLVHATVLSSGPAGPVATTYVGVFSRSGETARIGFPAGWTTGGFANQGSVVAGPRQVTLTAGGPEHSLALDVGEFGMVHATGPAPDGGGLEISAGRDAGGGLGGTVRNPTAFALDDVAVFVGSTATNVGSLAPGEERTFTVVDANLPRFDGGGAEFTVWAGLRQGPGGDQPADIGLWDAALRAGGLNFRSPDSVLAAGWTREFVPPVRVSGHPARPEGRTLVIGRQPLALAAHGVAGSVARRDIVRDPFVGETKSAASGAGSVVRFVLPDGADTSNLTLSGPFASAELWQDGGWRATSCLAEGCGGKAPLGFVPKCLPGAPCPTIQPFRGVASLLDVPAGAVRDGIVYVRVDGPASADQGVAFTLGRRP